MELFVLIIIIIVIVAVLGSKKKPPNSNIVLNERQQPEEDEMSEEESNRILNELISEIEINIEVGTNSHTSDFPDTSIIEVSNESYKLPSSSMPQSVPYWPHFYVYSYEDLNRATKEQRDFYIGFKNRFLNGEYLDIQDNTNYAFILLFDILGDSDHQPSLDITEERLKALSKNYPRTKPYCRSFLIEKMRNRSDFDGVIRVSNDDSFHTYSTDSDFNFYKLGTKYKKTLQLSEYQEQLINKLYHPNNIFCNIDFCLINTIRLFLLMVEEFNKEETLKNSSLEKELDEIAVLIATQQFQYKPESYHYKYALVSTKDELYRLLFKFTENALREHYGHKRKINTDYLYNAQIRTTLEVSVLSKLPLLFSKIISNIPEPDEASELALNEQNTSRWKPKLEKIIKNNISNGADFLSAVINLGHLNQNNPSIEKLFFESSKAVAKIDRQVALILYIHYLYHDLRSATFDNKQLTKTVQKSLFKNNEELHEFEKIISELIKDKNLENAIASVPKIYSPRRKKIKLDASAITEVNKRHAATVEILDEILGDEYEDDTSFIKTEQISSNEVRIEINQKTEVVPAVLVSNPYGLNSLQLELLEIFAKHSFILTSEDMDGFVRVKGTFTHSVIDGINEVLYSHLDDLLIEEEDNSYIMQQHYYQKIIS